MHFFQQKKPSLPPLPKALHITRWSPLLHRPADNCPWQPKLLASLSRQCRNINDAAVMTRVLKALEWQVTATQPEIESAKELVREKVSCPPIAPISVDDVRAFFAATGMTGDPLQPYYLPDVDYPETLLNTHYPAMVLGQGGFSVVQMFVRRQNVPEQIRLWRNVEAFAVKILKKDPNEPPSQLKHKSKQGFSAQRRALMSCTVHSYELERLCEPGAHPDGRREAAHPEAALQQVGPQELASRCIGLMRKPHDKTEDEARKTTKTSSTTIDTQDGCGWVHERHGEEARNRTTAGGLGFARDAMEVNGHQEVTARQTMQAGGSLDRNDMNSEASAATRRCSPRTVEQQRIRTICHVMPVFDTLAGGQVVAKTPCVGVLGHLKAAGDHKNVVAIRGARFLLDSCALFMAEAKGRSLAEAMVYDRRSRQLTVVDFGSAGERTYVYVDSSCYAAVTPKYQSPELTTSPWRHLHPDTHPDDLMDSHSDVWVTAKMNIETEVRESRYRRLLGPKQADQVMSTASGRIVGRRAASYPEFVDAEPFWLPADGMPPTLPAAYRLFHEAAQLLYGPSQPDVQSFKDFVENHWLAGLVRAAWSAARGERFIWKPPAAPYRTD
ncbi:unnamed protein product [Vitrella brassicaformis CCMP3155]|uniref:Protein kinase domain-containing protein n=1 Tax=Vitrella brassicaformis (strain CCMP3155) TaxID=1169540 RepID=A0A0G4EQ71_VITBC|nr:unnamed protein product [Vitrella brassicaformis CCMP3155]|eukprot:CEL99759.1 unnamed protein product [Vitrella brassicaformis CCMP3155]